MYEQSEPQLLTKIVDQIIKENNTRQSERIKNQSQGGSKSTGKAADVIKKGSVEGNFALSENSFAVFNNDDLMLKAQKMGIKTDNLSLQQFDILKDLELARAGLNMRNDSDQNKVSTDTSLHLPSEEIKFIEWQSDESDSDGFTMVSSKKMKKRKVKRKVKVGESVEKGTHPLDGRVQDNITAGTLSREIEAEKDPPDGGRQGNGKRLTVMVSTPKDKDSQPLDGKIQKSGEISKVCPGYNLRKVGRKQKTKKVNQC